ncbi:hypothetical protein [Pedobacter agri]|uniref:Uncharacterized protein n=1 Tax=Pedobacter agri TaxID=454586 RepID=A0A9X3IAV1_9SPHI|nr:hypothetical protein [Pedobacter agri]MCX3267281.1 hypothetical protein [Pedobacter agri]
MICLKQFVLAFTIIVSTSNLIFAKARIPIGERGVLNTVHDLPDTDEFKLDNGNYLDLATLHKEFNIAYILPLYITQEPKLVGYDEKTERYFDLPESELKQLLLTQKLNQKDLIGLPFYTRYGAKLIVILFVAFLIWGNLPYQKPKVTPTTV